MYYLVYDKFKLKIRVTTKMSYEASLKVFNTIIFPHFNYCCTIWSNIKNKGNIDKLYRLQKRAARIILNEKDRYSPTSVLFRELRWMSLPDYYTFRKLILVFKILHNLTPDYLNVFKYVHQVSTGSTRLSTSNSLYVPRARTQYFKRSFNVSAAILWNELPESLRNCTTLKSFKSAYLQNYFNS